MDETMFFFITSWVFSISTAGLLVAWRTARTRARHAETQLAELLRLPQGSRAPSDEQFMSEIDALRLEMERLAEGQRFFARVLTERPATSEAPARAHSGRVNTPH